ncbi:MAG: NAD(P)H-dependent glycerol-3-phosphate dehydrogenase [Thiomonas sp.]
MQNSAGSFTFDHPTPPSVAILGAGAWGTALACALRRGGLEVRLWARRPDLCHAITTQARNPRHLPDLDLVPGLQASSQMAEVLDGAAAVFMAVPSAALRDVARAAAPLLARRAVVLAACKGIERGSGALMSQVLQQELRPDGLVAAIGGPSFAHEVVRGQPAVLTLGLPALRLRQAVDAQRQAQRVTAGLRAAFATGGVQLEVTDDVIGVQVGGALKNIIAIACGMALGSEAGENARAAILTRGLQDIRALTLALGGRPDTLLSSAGAGDLFLTASSAQSRNTRLGMLLGRDELAEQGDALAEGAVSCHSVQTLECRLGLRLAVAAAVRDVLTRRQTAAEALRRLLNEPLLQDDGLVQPVASGMHAHRPLRDVQGVRATLSRVPARQAQ